MFGARRRKNSFSVKYLESGERFSVGFTGALLKFI